MASIDRNFPSSPDGYADIQATITVTREPGDGGNTFWANQWYYARGGESGYIGLQQRSGTAKFVNFSIWGASSWEELAPGSYCRYFSHEGLGVQCDMPFAWKTGVTYQMTVERTAPMSWRASITDTQSEITTPLAIINVPDDRGGISSLGQWVENFSPELPSCEAVPPAVATFGMPTANGGTVAPVSSSSKTYGNCAHIARAVCTIDQICTLSANPQLSTVAVSAASIPADGSTTSTVTVTVRDLNGDPVGTGGDTVTMATDLGTLGAVKDNGDGTYTASLSGTVAGASTVTFKVNGIAATNTATVALVAVPTASTSTVAASAASIPPDGSTTSTVTVTVRDLNGDPVVVGGDTVTMATDLGTLGAVKDNGDGTYTASLSGTVAGVSTVTFKVNGIAATNTATVALVAVPTTPEPTPTPPAVPTADLASTGIDLGTGLALAGLLFGGGLTLALAYWRGRLR
ncbi:MAG: invasin domain 3-containing protein [Leifsonia sp.]